MITDKLGKIVKSHNKIAIAELKLNDAFMKSAHLVLATVEKVFNDHLIIKYDTGMIDNEFISKEFVIVEQTNEKAVYNMSSLEMPLVGCLNVK